MISHIKLIKLPNLSEAEVVEILSQTFWIVLFVSARVNDQVREMFW